MATKRKTLPKDFESLLKKGVLQELIQLFDKCEIEARGGYAKQSALAFSECPHELAQWLINHGADIEAIDDYNNTPLYERSRRYNGNITSLIALGADVNRNDGKNTPLHCAAQNHSVENVKILLAHGAKTEALVSYGYGPNKEDYTPLELALLTCNNIDIENMVEISRILLDAGAHKTERMKELVTKIGERFEFYNPNFDDQSDEWSNNGLGALYRIYDVEPVAKRIVYDGKSPITAKAKTWQKQHAELWELLVPSSGLAQTMQGEVIRISGRMARELKDNGGINWDEPYKIMADSFLEFVQNAETLSTEEITELATIVGQVKLKNDSNIYRLTELGVKWVLNNPVPIALPQVKYDR
jgi:hypothetical protein